MEDVTPRSLTLYLLSTYLWTCRGYRYKIADGIYPNDDNSNDSIDGYYVDGVSITHGSNTLLTFLCKFNKQCFLFCISYINN